MRSLNAKLRSDMRDTDVVNLAYNHFAKAQAHLIGPWSKQNIHPFGNYMTTSKISEFLSEPR
jgi:hypothetical protein